MREKGAKPLKTPVWDIKRDGKLAKKDTMSKAGLIWPRSRAWKTSASSMARIIDSHRPIYSVKLSLMVIHYFTILDHDLYLVDFWLLIIAFNVRLSLWKLLHLVPSGLLFHQPERMLRGLLIQIYPNRMNYMQGLLQSSHLPNFSERLVIKFLAAVSSNASTSRPI